MSKFDTRLVAYSAGGERLGILPNALEFSASFPHNDLGSLRAKFSRHAINGSILGRDLTAGTEFALEVTNQAGGWVEPDGARFIWLNADDDPTSQAQTIDIVAPAYGWLLRKAKDLNLTGRLPDGHPQAGKREFAAATPGQVLTALLQENSARGGIPLGHSTFNSNHDSAGKPWDHRVTFYYELGVGLDQVLEGLAAQGMVDWRTHQRELLVFNPDTNCGADKSEIVQLHIGRDVAEAPSSASLEEMASTILLIGDNLWLTVSDQTAPTPWGRWEEYVTQGGVADEATARTLAANEQARRARVRAQYTRDLILNQAQFWPLVDYQVGNWITAPTDVRQERVRIQQVSIAKDSGGTKANLVLNDRVLVDELRRAKQARSLNGGAASGGAAGAAPSGDVVDSRPPAAPTGLVVSTDVFLTGSGEHQGLLIANWSKVVFSGDGTTQSVDRYEVQIRHHVATNAWRTICFTDKLTASVSDLILGEEYEVRVRAYGARSSVPGAFCEPLIIKVAKDTDPPPTPSTLTVEVDLAVARVGWDGRTRDDGLMPPDFQKLLIFQEGKPSPVGWLTGAGDAFVPIETSVPVRFRAIAVDRTGNQSPASAWSQSVTAKPLVDDHGISEALAALNDELIMAGLIAQQADWTAANAENIALEALAKAGIVMVIHSSNGNVFKNGQIGNSVLTCRLYQAGNEIDVNGTQFVYLWTKKNNDGSYDAIWNSNHQYSTKQITITKDDIWQRATFECIANPLY